jgi:sarcosine oxidase/L-pipecolate oxidase
VRFVLGERAGRVAQLLYSGSRVTGIRTADGKTHDAATTICALGAHAASLIPALGRFAAARCWSVAHVQLTKRECDYLRGIPTTNIRDLGFFFEPDPETRLFKLCPLGVGYTNPDASKQGISLPPGDVLPPPQDFIPAEDERKLRRLLQEVFPWMADRPFVEQKLCWFSDTKDSEYCIDFVPGTEKSLVVLSGDSGHGFKMMPVFGKWVVDLLSKGEQGLERWQWRDVPEGAEGGWGEAVSWRIGKERKLVELIEEKEKLIRAKL